MDINAVVERVRKGNKNDFRLIIQHCNQPLYRTALMILKNDAECEDALQTTYLKAYQNLETFRGDSSFVTWITRILINECKMTLRKRRPVSSLETREVAERHSNFENAVDTLTKQQVNQWLERSILELPEKYRLVYVTREVNEMSTEETASTLGISGENVKVRLHRARTLIKESMLKHVNAQELFTFGSKRCDQLTARVMNQIETLVMSA